MAEIYQKGQVVIPGYIRKIFNLRPGDSVSFAIENERIVMGRTDAALKDFESLCAGAKCTDRKSEAIMKRAEQRRTARWKEHVR